MEEKNSNHFPYILNPYGKKISNYEKIGRKRRLSKLNIYIF